MDDLTYQQQRQEKDNDTQTEAWLRNNGITAQQFIDLDIGLLQAQHKLNLASHYLVLSTPVFSTFQTVV